MQITDRMTILRRGRSMGVHNTADVTPEKISRLMVGRDVILSVQKETACPKEEVLRVRDLEYVNEWGKKCWIRCPSRCVRAKFWALPA